MKKQIELENHRNKLIEEQEIVIKEKEIFMKPINDSLMEVRNNQEYDSLSEVIKYTRLEIKSIRQNIRELKYKEKLHLTATGKSLLTEALEHFKGEGTKHLKEDDLFHLETLVTHVKQFQDCTCQMPTRYVYEHLDSEGVRFYVGQGSYDDKVKYSRMKTKAGRSEEWFKRAENGWTCNVIYDGLTKNEATKMISICIRDSKWYVKNGKFYEGPSTLVNKERVNKPSKNKWFEEKQNKLSYEKMRKNPKNRAVSHRAVRQYDKEGYFEAEYYAPIGVWLETGITIKGILACCRGDRKSAAGKQYRYTDKIKEEPKKES